MTSPDSQRSQGAEWNRWKQENNWFGRLNGAYSFFCFSPPDWNGICLHFIGSTFFRSGQFPCCCVTHVASPFSMNSPFTLASAQQSESVGNFVCPPAAVDIPSHCGLDDILNILFLSSGFKVGAECIWVQRFAALSCMHVVAECVWNISKGLFCRHCRVVHKRIVILHGQVLLWGVTLQLRISMPIPIPTIVRV